MKLSIIKKRKKYLLSSGILIIFSLCMILFWNLNLWIDMTGWTQAEYSYSNISIDEMRIAIAKEASNIVHNWKEVINSTSVYKISWQNALSVVVWFDSSIAEKELSDLKENFRTITLNVLQASDNTVEESAYTNIWKSFWDYIKNTAITTLLIALVAIAIYVAWTFSWVVSGISSVSFAIIVIATLFHDVVIATGMYIFAGTMFPEFKIDTFFITALLTILGYSINDTIVIFDRIRSNLEKETKKWNKLKNIIDLSVTESLRRSIYTSVTLLFVLITIFMFGPESISWFVLVMIFGTIIGTYSSIFIASPLLYELNKNKDLKVIDKKAYNPDDKIVV